MNLKNVKEIEKNKVELTVVIEKEAFEAAIAKVFKKNVKKISVPGFKVFFINPCSFGNFRNRLHSC